MGASFQLPIFHSHNLDGELMELRQRHFTLIAAVADESARPLGQMDRPERFAILLGNESHGLSDQWVSRCDWRVTIPMNDRADSLNVAVATGIFLYHFCRPGVNQPEQ
jgi:tRNA G18 (ribose-2'-O)-methylase SpoU